MDDSKRPFSDALTPLDAAVEIAKLDCPHEWARYCELAQQLAERDSRTEISPENAARELLAADGESVHQKEFEMGRMASFSRQLAGGSGLPLEPFEIVLKETQKLEELFRNQLASALRSGRYSLIAFEGLNPVTVPPILLRPELFRFGSGAMELNGIKLTGVHFVRPQAVPAAQNDAPGRRPGQNSPKDLACEIVLSILNDEAQRPPKRHGRLTALARMVQAVLGNEGKSYAVNSIEKFIRGTVQDWEKRNPDQ